MSRPIRLVSLNAWGGTMYPELERWLEGCDADIVCLQEMTRTPGITGWTRYDDADRSLPQRANLYADVGELLDGYDGSFAPSDAGPVTVGDGQTLRQEFGLAVFVSDRLTVIDRATRFVHGAFAVHRSWPRDRPRVAQAVRLVDEPSGLHLAVIHVHGLRDPAGKADTAARAAQADRLAQFVEDTRRAGDVTVVCGDLNLLPDSRTFDVLGEIGLTDLVGGTDTRTSHYPKPVRHASYLLLSDPELVIAFEAKPQPEVSDHRILELDLATVARGQPTSP